MDNGNPGYFNRYAYTMNDPVNMLDPDGRESALALLKMQKANPIKPASPRAQAIANSVMRAGAAFSPAGPGVDFIDSRDSGNGVMKSIGIAAAGAVNPFKKLESVGDAGKTIYRAVDDVELAAIQKTGKFELGPNGAEVKAFVDNPGDAQALASQYSKQLGTNHTVVKGTAPSSVVDGAERYNFTDVPGNPMEAIAVRGQQQLDKICNAGTC